MTIIIMVLLSALLLLHGGFMADAAEQSLDKEIRKACELIESGKTGQAAGKLLKLSGTRGLDEKTAGIIGVMLARAYRLDGQAAKALAVLNGIGGEKPEEYYIELGECLYLDKSYDKALSAAGHYGGKARQPSILDARALWLKARIRFETQDYSDCMKSCRGILDFALKHGSEGEMTDDDKKILGELVNLKRLAKELYEKARNLYDIMTYGEDYAWYRLGRTAEFDGKYGDAISCYAKIKGGILKDAGTCYSANCMAKLGNVREALEAYRKFHEADPGGLYREEALYNAALLTYRTGTGDGSVKDSLELVMKLEECLSAIATSQRRIELAGINDALKREVVDAAPRELLRSDDCGNLIRNDFLPETISNRLTAPWYLPYYQTRAGLLHGFLLGEGGDAKSAAMRYRDAMKTGKIRIISSPDTLPSLLSGLVDGFYLLPGECRKRLPARYFNMVSLASFLCVTEENLQARGIFEDLVDDASLKPETYAGNAVRLGLAYCLLAERRTGDAEKILSILHARKRRRGEVLKRASYIHACMLASDPSEKQKVYGIFGELAASKDEKCDIGQRALLASAMAAVNYGDFGKASENIDLIGKMYGGTVYADAAKTLGEAIRASAGKKDRNLLKPLECATGKLVLFRRTMVIPALTSIEPDSSQFGPGDMVVYRLKCVARDPCQTVKGVIHRLGDEEPQIPPVKGNEIVFLRIPLLYIRNLRYDFMKEFPALDVADGTIIK